jgi:hypothetical protein
MTKLLKYITGGLFVFLLILAFWAGWKVHSKFRPCPEVQRDTIRIYDTVIHFIPDTVPYYIIKKDTVIINHNIPAIVDTNAILAEFYNFHYYTRDWYDINQSDTLIHIRLEDVISENMPLDNNFSYRYYVPQTIINNSVTNVSYSSYLYGTLTLPVPDTKYASLGLSYASGRGLIGVGYMPLTKGFVVTGGFKLIRFRQI